ncbi:MAG: AraC family transcriptional regulator [Candidatus Cohnella colombiensis]|uniref:AraC family transcriptional regulator n=1 Tax=Candidatus Cohnella colombiensis TaxID=3121368 RepID=A0AA95JG68_9BACL|nr:MAG: AraC family transcriptional regulator [Cohnella sp.]
MSSFPYARMETKPDALDRLDLQFKWGNYRIRILRCHLIQFPPGHIIHFHKHSEFEFHFIPKGKGKVIIGDQSYNLHEGLFYVTGPDVIHYQESDNKDPMYELCLHCEIVPLEQAAEQGSVWVDELEVSEAHECVEALHAVPTFPTVDRFHAMSWFLEAYRAWEEQPLGVTTQMKQAMLQILLRAVRSYDDRLIGQRLPERDMNFHRYQLASQYIQDNEGMQISLEQVAERINVSPRQLQRIFRSAGQTTFREYLEHIRMTHICNELLQTNKSIEEIALIHGYMNPNYMYPVFKRKYKVTPAAYRRMHGRSASSEGADENTNILDKKG